MTNQPNPNKTENSQTENGKGNPDSQQSSQIITTQEGEEPSSTLQNPISKAPTPEQLNQNIDLSNPWLIIAAVALIGVGLWLDLSFVGIFGTIAALLLSLRTVVPAIQKWIFTYLTSSERRSIIGIIGFIAGIIGLGQYLGVYRSLNNVLSQFQYDEFGSWAEWVGAVGQIMIALLAVYVAWEQYVISKDLTIQQNRITQQQTIDTYFQGVSDLALNEEGLLEDWPQERAIAEGRTAAILGSVDAGGKAKILRFLSQSKLVTPLMRDRHLGRPILDGSGGYAEDRAYGIRVIDLNVMLAGADLSGQDLRWTDLTEANMVRANLSNSDFVKANLSRTVLYEANLARADFKGTRLFYGSVETASPRSRTAFPDYNTGAHTGAVVERANFTGVKRLDEEQRYYLCAWGGEKTRATIPGGCEDIPNKLGR